MLRHADLRVDALFRHVDAAEHLQFFELNVQAVAKRFGIVDGEIFVKETVVRGSVSASMRAFSSSLEIRLCNTGMVYFPVFREVTDHRAQPAGTRAAHHTRKTAAAQPWRKRPVQRPPPSVNAEASIPSANITPASANIAFTCRCAPTLPTAAPKTSSPALIHGANIFTL